MIKNKSAGMGNKTGFVRSSHKSGHEDKLSSEQTGVEAWATAMHTCIQY